MKKFICPSRFYFFPINIFIFVLLLFPVTVFAHKANLIEVYNQALLSDPTYQAAISQTLSAQEGVPINLSGLLPYASAVVNPFTSRVTSSGSASVTTPYTSRGYNVTLTATQTIFDFGKLQGVIGAQQIARQADANLNLAAQNLMLRVSQAYFQILLDEDNARYILSTKTAYQNQLDQVNQQYNVGLKTITDVYTARASYDTASADYIAALNSIDNDKENLRVITGVLYHDVAPLSEKFPLVSPKPTNIEIWVNTALKQNWGIRAAHYFAMAAKANVKQQFAGHLPNLGAQGTYEINVAHNDVSARSIFTRSGSSQTHTGTAGLVLNIPIVSGGLVIAETNKAEDDYQVAMQQFDLQVRNTISLTRQSYLGVVAGVSKISADKAAIKSSVSSLQGMQAGYQVGTEILVNVLNQQQNVFLAQQQYSIDRYAYVNNLLTLKQAAGILSPADLEEINSWLLYDSYGSETKQVQKKIYKGMSVAVNKKKVRLAKSPSVPLLKKGKHFNLVRK